jgi:cytochrome P450 family 109
MQQSYRSGPQTLASSLPRTWDEAKQAYAWFEKMRKQAPVYYDEKTHIWHIFRYEDVNQAITDYNHFSSRIMGIITPLMKDTLITQDPPEHRKLRNLVNQAFTPRAVAHRTELIRRITQEQLDEVKSQGRMDIIPDLAFPLPAKVIADMLGVPSEDWDIFRRWASTDLSTGQQGDAQSTRNEISEYLARLLVERRRDSQDDLVSALSVAEVDGERLSEQELVNFCFLLLVAGQETTKHLLANTILLLTEYPEAMAQLVSEPALAPSAIEEVLRYLSPAWMVLRQARTDVEMGGQHIPANSIVIAWLTSANHDESQFPDPERFDIRREPKQHIAFGHGIHFCIGAPLARLETQVALPMILAQLHDLQRVKEIPIRVNDSSVFMLNTLPVTFRAD